MIILDSLNFFETKSTKFVGKSGCKAVDGFRVEVGYISLKQKGQKLGVRGIILESSDPVLTAISSPLPEFKF